MPTTIIVEPGDGTTDHTFDDILLPASDVAASDTATYYVGGTNVLQSLYVGSSIEVDFGVFSQTSLRGTGSITGSNDQSATLPAIVNYGVFDINGSIAIAFFNYSKLEVSNGERLRLEGDFTSTGGATINVASGGELDLNSLNTALIGNLTVNGVFRDTAPNLLLSGDVSFAGAVFVQGDASNGIGSGTAAPRSTGTPNGTYVATLDLRSANVTAPINSLTLGQDAQIRFGTADTSIKRFAVAGSASGLVAQDVINLDGTVTVTGDGTGAANQVTISRAEFAGGGTLRFAVAASDGGASLGNVLLVDANTKLRNDGSMTIGGQTSGTTTLGAAAAAAGSTFINGSTGTVTIGAGATLGVAAIQNAGFLDVTSGTVSLQSALTGAGTVAVENGATLSIGNVAAQGTFALRNGATLQLSQPSSFTGTIQTPSIGARIAIAGSAVTSATVSNGSINLTTASGTLTIAETGLLQGSSLTIGADGTASVTASTLPHPVGYRFFDRSNGTHFFTTSATESQSVQNTRPDLIYEGIGLAAADPSVDPAAAPVFRFFDTRYGTHFYTSSSTERDTVSATRADLTYEGIGFYEHTTAQAGDVAVYRFFDTKFGTHFYTSSENERSTIAATRPDLVSEGVGFYAPTLT